MSDYPATPPNLPEDGGAPTPPPKGSEDQQPEGSEEKSGPSRPERVESPEPNCAICLEHVENMSYTDSCLHKFCFTCLLEWSRIKPECPLCKAKFKAIIHNIRSDDNYQSYTIPQREDPQAIQRVASAASMQVLEEMRRFRYASTLQQIPSMPSASLQIHSMRIWPQNNFQRSDFDGLHSHRRRGIATTDFRRNIYRQNLYVNPDSCIDTTGRFRETSPAWYRSNPAQTHRLVPWLNRELNTLLQDPQRLSVRVTDQILNLIQAHDIMSSQFRLHMMPYIGENTRHFQHEFYNFARSCYDMVGFDAHAIYGESRLNLATEVVSSDSDSEILVLEEVNNRPSARGPSASTQTEPVEIGQGTSRGQSSRVEPPIRRLVEQPTSPHDDVDNEEVAVVGEVKPRHLRTPVVVDLSDDDVDVPVVTSPPPTVKQEGWNDTIDLSSGAEDQVPPPNSTSAQRWSSSEDEAPLRKKSCKGKGQGKRSGAKKVCPSQDAREMQDQASSSRLISPMRLLPNWRSNFCNDKRTSESEDSSSSDDEIITKRRRKKSAAKERSRGCLLSSSDESFHDLAEKRKSKDSGSSKDRKRKNRKGREERREKRWNERSEQNSRERDERKSREQSERKSREQDKSREQEKSREKVDQKSREHEKSREKTDKKSRTKEKWRVSVSKEPEQGCSSWFAAPSSSDRLRDSKSTSERKKIEKSRKKSMKSDAMDKSPKRSSDGARDKSPKSSTDGARDKSPKSSTDGARDKSPKSSTDGARDKSPKSSTDGARDKSPKSSTDGARDKSPKRSTDVARDKSSTGDNNPRTNRGEDSDDFPLAQIKRQKQQRANAPTRRRILDPELLDSDDDDDGEDDDVTRRHSIKSVVVVKK